MRVYRPNLVSLPSGAVGVPKSRGSGFGLTLGCAEAAVRFLASRAKSDRLTRCTALRGRPRNNGARRPVSLEQPAELGDPMANQKALARALLGLRLTIFAVMAVWAIDKLLDPRHTNLIFQHFYGVHGMGDDVARTLGVFEFALLIAFVAGIWKRWTYGIVLLLHAVSTFSSLREYLTPWRDDHLMFFAAWPMLAGCYTLFTLRDSDVLLTVRRG